MAETEFIQNFNNEIWFEKAKESLKYRLTPEYYKDIGMTSEDIVIEKGHVAMILYPYINSERYIEVTLFLGEKNMIGVYGKYSVYFSFEMKFLSELFVYDSAIL